MTGCTALHLFPVFTDLSLSTISLITVTCIMASWVDQGLDGCALRKAVHTSASTCSGESRSFYHSMMLRSQGSRGRQTDVERTAGVSTGGGEAPQCVQGTG